MQDGLFPEASPANDSADRVYIRVAVERGLDRGSADATLTYAAPADPLGSNEVRVGGAVEVPLGRGNTPTRGIVIQTGGADLLEGFDPKRVKAIGRVLGAPLTPDLVELARWMSRYYQCPLGMTLASMIPAAVKADTGRRTQVLLSPTAAVGDPPPEGVALPPTARRAWQAMGALDADAFPASARDLADAIGERSIAAVNRLVRAGLLAEHRATTVRAREEDQDGVFHASTTLAPTDAQSDAISAVAASFGSFARHLLFGVTGSGKTEVYLHLLDRVLDLGMSAIMLVPEIALTPQTAGRVRSRLGPERVAVLHSGLTQAQRNRAWSRVTSGRCPVIVGARSAIFAPVDRLGLVIVDEEHDGSYKQDQLPRYQARDVAIKRAHQAGCPVVLGSATPSLESWRAARTGASTLLRLPARVGGRSMPEVRVVDMADERRTEAAATGRSPRELIVGPTLRAGLTDVLLGGGQAVLLLNRRGYAGLVACSSAACGWQQMCDHCDAKLVLHQDTSLRRGGYVRCHHCHAEQIIPDRCPDCGSKLQRLGAGTQRAEAALEAATADLPPEHRLVTGETMLRVDADTMRTARDYFEALGRFARGEVRALLGTQMIAKGLDVPGVRLVGVLSADTSLHLPDFRASERTYQLVSQVAGRAGRGDLPGRVIVQTFEPESAAIVRAASHDFESFADDELRMREVVGLPPVWRMARIVCRDRDPAKARRAASEIAEAIRGPIEGLGGRIDGPMPCPIERIADHFRIGIELTAPNAEAIQRVLRLARDRGLVKSDANTAVDVDPVSLM
ncbi:MAG: primosomal protein N' [Planctomycetota bacterium]